MAASILTWPPLSIHFFVYGVWHSSNQLEAELASNLPWIMCKIAEYDIKFANFKSWLGHQRQAMSIWRMDRSRLRKDEHFSKYLEINFQIVENNNPPRLHGAWRAPPNAPPEVFGSK